MRRWMISVIGGSAAVIAAVLAWAQPPEEPKAIRERIAQVARIQLPSFEATKRVRNERCGQLFRDYVKQTGGPVTAEVVRRFNGLLREQGLTTFDEFRAVEMAPLQYRKDPKSGEQVPMLGPLGSDVINSWLSDLDVVPGKPLDEQPIYRLAGNALREHVDFVMIGVCDPNLSLDQLPPKLRENAVVAYRRLNPTNRFNGGFDHPLFYATVREAAKKLFRQDYPHLRISMADVVKSPAVGGFGISSCLLCHEQDHTGVYQRLLGQGLYLKARAGEAPAGSTRAVDTTAQSESFLRAAEIVRSTFPDKVDVAAARRGLAGLSADNLARLRPGFPDLCATLDKFGCLSCHSTAGKAPADKNPADFGGFVLDLNNYHQTANIKALLATVNTEDLGKSALLLKGMAKMNHEGSDAVKLDRAQADEMRLALVKWVGTLDSPASSLTQKPSPKK